MDFINIERLVLCIRSSPLVHPFFIFPLVIVDIPYNGSIIWTQLCIISIWVCLHHRQSSSGLDLIFIKASCFQARNEQLKYAGISFAYFAHLVASAVP